MSEPWDPRSDLRLISLAEAKVSKIKYLCFIYSLFILFVFNFLSCFVIFRWWDNRQIYYFFFMRLLLVDQGHGWAWKNQPLITTFFFFFFLALLLRLRFISYPLFPNLGTTITAANFFFKVAIWLHCWYHNQPKDPNPSRTTPTLIIFIMIITIIILLYYCPVNWLAVKTI